MSPGSSAMSPTNDGVEDASKRGGFGVSSSTSRVARLMIESSLC